MLGVMGGRMDPPSKLASLNDEMLLRSTDIDKDSQRDRNPAS